MKKEISIKKRLVLVVFLSALTGMAVDGAVNVATAELTEADCRECHIGDYYMNIVTMTWEYSMGETHHKLQRTNFLPCQNCHEYDSEAEPGTNIWIPENDCTVCHINIDHPADHDYAGVPSQGCTNCHDENVVVEHVDNSGLSCSVCHDDPAYDAVIEDGKNDIFVTCFDCHDQDDHHSSKGKTP